jgi:NAD(P)-dependent dehydrogenase (short-subunit alcohol dehydrogenase family)
VTGKRYGMNKLFKNRVVLISGGLGDIGRAMAIQFAQQGASIALCGQRPAAAASEFLAEIRKFNVSCSYASVDVADATAVKEWIAQVEKELGVSSIIIANAAIVTLARLHEITPDQWSHEIQVNLNGAFYLAQMATERLLHHKQPGRLVFVGSWAGSTPHAHIPAYCVSKAGMRMLCKCMALELAPHGILVNEIAPGYVEAGLSGRVWEEKPELGKEALQKVPIHKLITPGAVAEQVIQLCHPSNEHMTGSTILMDGGLSLLS